MRWLPLLMAAGLVGCRGPSPEEIGLAVLLGLPAGWLAFGILLAALGALFARWRAPSWLGWKVGFGVLAVAWLGVAVLAPGIDWELVIVALLTSVPAMVAWSLLLWRLLLAGRAEVPHGLNWGAPLVFTVLWAVAAVAMVAGDRFELAVAVWVYTGFVWIGPAVVLAVLLIEGGVRRARASA